MRFINIPEFISKNITLREKSLFQEDLEKNHTTLKQRIEGKIGAPMS